MEFLPQRLFVETISDNWKKGQKYYAPGEARTHDLRISSATQAYKYDALTDYATGAPGSPAFKPFKY